MKILLILILFTNCKKNSNQYENVEHNRNISGRTDDLPSGETVMDRLIGSTNQCSTIKNLKKIACFGFCYRRKG